MRPLITALVVALVLPACAPVDADEPAAQTPAPAMTPVAPVELATLAPATVLVGDATATDTTLTRPDPTPPVVLPPASIVVSSQWSDLEPVTGASSFPLYGTSDLVLYLYFNGLADNDYLAWLEYVAPGGAVYQQDPIAFTVGDQVGAQTMEVPGLWTPVQVRPAQRTALGWRVTELLPLDGTNVVRHGMSGGWTVRLYFETVSGQPVASSSFTLTE